MDSYYDGKIEIGSFDLQTICSKSRKFIPTPILSGIRSNESNMHATNLKSKIADSMFTNQVINKTISITAEDNRDSSSHIFPGG
jgi:hypothetical protein